MVRTTGWANYWTLVDPESEVNISEAHTVPATWLKDGRFSPVTSILLTYCFLRYTEITQGLIRLSVRSYFIAVPIVATRHHGTGPGLHMIVADCLIRHLLSFSIRFLLP